MTENGQKRPEAGAIRETEHCWIPMPDGTRLAARIWWPADRGSFPAILEYIPYRKRDMVRARDERNHPYFATHGYVCLRVDMRGSGDSEGHMPDMYSDDELADARYVIEWIAAQDWCNGHVGMFGTSWGGTACLQAAVDAPGPLKAVIANCATANRFDDDIHWMGGALLTDSLEWGTTLPAILAAPPDASTVGDGWLDLWKERLQDLAFPLDAWIRHRTRGKYWRHGSAMFRTERLSCPILSIGGWSDRYSNSVMGLVRARPDICWGIVGPWGHHYPDQGEPGPAIGFQDLALEWWNRWLGNGVGNPPNWPRLRIWKREFDPPGDRLAMRNGEWIETAGHEEAGTRTLFLCTDSLTNHPPTESGSLEIPNDLRHGECAGDTGYFGRLGGLPLEQSADDGRSLCFDSAPLEEDLDLIGHAELSFDIVRDLVEAQLVCRLCEVTPDDQSSLVVRQIRNLALDDTLDDLSPFSDGKPARYRVRLPSTAYRFVRGNRIRLALGTSYWPLAWPPSRPASVRILTRQARLILPSLVHKAGLSVPLPEARSLPARRSWKSESEGQLQREQPEPADHRIDSSWNQPRITFRFPEAGIAISLSTSAHYRTDTRDWSELTCTMDHVIEIFRKDGTARIGSSLFSRADHGGLEIQCTLSVHWNRTNIAEKVWRHAYLPPFSDIGRPEAKHPGNET
ncbi:MAG: CocE/NonD family hydrolase [Gammaproteobacteria bacterium]|nr:CocE/NonD family hydrolase [Gammaproteobacteria bacterium]MYD75257.1 CocE/NonD family hydrolase [Gammaproteobacteria bacterium]